MCVKIEVERKLLFFGGTGGRSGGNRHKLSERDLSALMECGVGYGALTWARGYTYIIVYPRVWG